MKAQKIKKNKARERREKEWDAELELEESMFNMLCPKKNIQCSMKAEFIDIPEKQRFNSYSSIECTQEISENENSKDKKLKNRSPVISNIVKSDSLRNTVSLLIGGTVDNTSYLEQRLEKLMRDCDISIKAKQVTADLALIRQAFSKHNIDVVDEIPFQLQAQKRYTVQKIKELFSVEAKLYIIFWTGHGEQGSGDWVFSECKTLSLDELLRLWKKAPLNKSKSHVHPKLLIISDCCYSGSWCQTLSDLQRVENSACRRVLIQASCASHQLAFGYESGSNFTRKFVSDIHLKDKPSPNPWCSIEQIPVFEAFEPESFIASDGSEVYYYLHPFRLVTAYPK